AVIIDRVHDQQDQPVHHRAVVEEEINAVQQLHEIDLAAVLRREDDKHDVADQPRDQPQKRRRKKVNDKAAQPLLPFNRELSRQIKDKRREYGPAQRKRHLRQKNSPDLDRNASPAEHQRSLARQEQPEQSPGYGDQKRPGPTAFKNARGFHDLDLRK